jgi:hypothetical protein
MEAKLYIVRWEGRDGDGAVVVRTTGDFMQAIRAACPEDKKIVGPIDFEFIKGAILYVPSDMEDDYLEANDEPDHIHGVYLVGAEETTIIEG